MTLNIKCPHCTEDINLNPYKKTIRQWLNGLAGSKRMAGMTAEQRSALGRMAVEKRWAKHKMGGQNPEKPIAEKKFYGGPGWWFD